MDKLLSPFRQGRLLNTLFVSNIFLALHYALIIYINSTFLLNYFSQTQISSLYIIGSILNIILLLNASKVIEKIGNYKFSVSTIFIEFVAVLGLALSSSEAVVGICFLLHLITIPLILFSFDVYLEDFTSDESQTGGIRATYLTITNSTVVISPLVVAFLVYGSDYKYVYIISSLLLIILYYLVRKYKNENIEPIKHIKVKETILEYLKDKDLYNVFITHFILQLFYAFMIVYTPIYLSQHMGFTWSEIGTMFSIMLLPFIMFEIPIGELADEKYGEKEFLTIGFVIMGLSTLFISFITVKLFWVWATVLFITRIGASFVEISSDSYFFKRVNQQKTNIISLFRVTRPLSFMVAPVIATISLQFLPFQYMFIIVGTIVILGCKYSLSIKDTK